MNRNIFISHSNKFIEISKYFAAFLKSRDLNPIVVDFMPNEGRLWSINEKVEHFMKISDSAILIATPDEIQDGNPIPRMDVIFELGRLKDKMVIILKERSTMLPKSLDPVFVPFDSDDPSGCLDQLDAELESIFGEGVISKIPFTAEPPRHRTRPAYTLDGKDLAPERPDLIQEEVRRIFLEKPKEEQLKIVGDVIDLLDNENEDTRWVAGLMLEEILEYDSSLVPKEAIMKMSRDKFFSVRSAASVCLFTLANIAPSRVPVDVAIRLASLDEDWYVFTPALATLKTLAHRMPRALDTIFRMTQSDNKDEAEYGVSALLDVVRNDPKILDEERLRPLEKSSLKYVQETVDEIKAVLKRGEYGPNVIRYSPF